jgi:hypothetical protein
VLTRLKDRLHANYPWAHYLSNLFTRRFNKPVALQELHLLLRAVLDPNRVSEGKYTFLRL